ncbi:PREDICTED: uncharacterized protein LOC106330522 [Brassica oleracea var. oleracea]|uniref:uncharacterized protein LOC106330522 n=1 Tax=Brassica oleracea var. oleracea TaxID=109376 RepID=UPI0006A72070|nr:PREDICTED: uncharacterized protein LOC106330522 [Brassica oleracea var. oleracea]
MVLILKQKVKHLQHKLEEARADLNAKEARIQELEYSKIESEFEGIFQGKIEAEIKHLVPTKRCLSTIESIVYAMKEMGEDTESLDNMLDFLNPWLEIKEDMKVAFGGVDSLCAKRHKMLEDMEKDFEGGQEADKLDGGGGSKSGGSLASGALGLEWKSLPDDSLALTNNDSSQWSVGTATSIRARFFVLNERLTIGEIIDSSVVGTFVTLGTIETIDTERGWQYLSCKYHNKKVMPTTNVDADDRPLFFCNTCDKEHSDVISRFKLIANVNDDSGEANFLLFDANAQAIVRHSAAELYDENEDEDFLPEAVSDLFGKRVLFEISVDADNIKGKSSQYVVRLATDDREMVEEFADLPPKSNPVLMLESADDISSGSVGFTATPLSKRKSEQDDDSCLEDQHSVNKKLSQKKLKGE